MVEVKKLIADIEQNTQKDIIPNSQNKVKKCDYNLTYYKRNKEKLQKNYKTKLACVLCDCMYSKSSMKSHMNNKMCKQKQEIKILQLQILNKVHNNIKK